MRKVVASALLASMVSAAAIPAAFADTQSASFVDIDNSYAKAAIQELFDKGIVAGMDTQGHFDPKGTLTRAQFAKIVVLEMGLKADAATSSFNDVTGWAVPYVEAAFKAGLVNGMGGGKFDPNAPVTREMAATILVRSLQSKGVLDDKDAALTFTDASSISGWAQPSIALAQKYSLVQGNPDGTFAPKTTANREMAAQMGVNLLRGVDVVVAANTAPVISNIHIASSNANPTLAKAGDTVTLTFTTTQEVSKLTNFKINGSNLASFTSTGEGNSWTNTATYVLDESDLEGVMNFQINVKNGAGIYSVTTEATTDGSSVTVLRAPVISGISLVSSNEDPTKAVVGDKVTLTFTTNQQVSKLGNFKINGSNPDTFASEEQADHTWKNTATYVIQDSDPVGAMNFQINVKNAAGVYSVTTEATTDDSAVTVAAPAATAPAATAPAATEPTATEPAADAVN